MTAIVFIGGGNMARALIGGQVARGQAAAEFLAIDPSEAARARLTAATGAATAGAVDERLGQAGIVVLAVKPQQMRAAARALSPYLDGQLVLSIAAGIRVPDLARWLGGYRRIVRAMPNTPALINAGISGLYADPAVDAAGRAAAQGVLEAAGEVLWFEHEDALDAVTAVSGSGPAYVFYFLEALQVAATELGLPPEAARRLAYATFSGAMRLAEQSDNEAASLRQQVTSKGGTTERALATLETAHLAEHFRRAVAAAAERAREMGDALGAED